MKWEEIENKLGDYIRTKEDEKTGSEFVDRLQSRVWSRIKNKTSSTKKITTFWWAAAVFIGVTALFGALYSISAKQKNSEIERLKLELASTRATYNNQLLQIQQKLAQNKVAPPEVKIVYKTRIVIKEQHKDIAELHSVKQTQTSSTDSLLKSSEISMANADESIFKGKMLRYKITYGDITGNDSTARTWKVTMTFQ